MTLKIAMTAAALIVRFHLPQAGTYYVISTSNFTDAHIESSGHVWGECEGAARIEMTGAHRIYWVWFIADPSATTTKEATQ